MIGVLSDTVRDKYGEVGHWKRAHGADASSRLRTGPQEHLRAKLGTSGKVTDDEDFLEALRARRAALESHEDAPSPVRPGRVRTKSYVQKEEAV